MEGEGRFKYKAPRDQMGHAGGCEINFWWRFLAARSRFGLCPLVGVALCPGVRHSELSPRPKTHWLAKSWHRHILQRPIRA